MKDLHSSYDLLSVIFGIFGKFRIDIGGKFFEKIFFEAKKISEKNLKKIFWGIFSIFPVEPLVNSNVRIN